MTQVKRAWGIDVERPLLAAFRGAPFGGDFVVVVPVADRMVFADFLRDQIGYPAIALPLEQSERSLSSK